MFSNKSIKGQKDFLNDTLKMVSYTVKCALIFIAFNLAFAVKERLKNIEERKYDGTTRCMRIHTCNCTGMYYKFLEIT